MNALIRVSVALYRRLLVRYPRRLRDAYGEEMVQAFRLLLEEAAAQRHAAWRMARVWWRVIRDGVRPLPTVPSGRRPLGRVPLGGRARDGVQRLRLGVRSLVRSPGFTVPALVILAVGITAVTAIFAVVDTILFRPLSFPDADRLVLVCEDHPRHAGLCIASPGNTEDLRRSTSSLAELGIGRGWHFTLGTDEGSVGVRGGLATAGFFRALGVEPVLGRRFADDEVGPDRDDVVVLSHPFWTSRFGGDPAVVGSVLRLDGEPYEVVGVLPAGFEAPFDMEGIELWKPPHFDPLDADVRGWRGFRAVGRLAADASLPSARAEMAAFYRGLAARYDEVDESWRLRVDPLLRVVVGDSRPVLLAFLGAAGLVLLIVCANVANLVLARGLDRTGELAVRTALGAGRSRLMGDMVLESLLVTGAATVLAVLCGSLVTRLLIAIAPPGIPRLDEVALDARVLGIVALVSVGATLSFALLPALRVTGRDLSGRVGSGTRGSPSRGSGRLRSGLVVAEVALAVVLVATAAVLTRSFTAHLHWEPGFERDRLLAVSAFVDVSAYGDAAAWVEHFRTLESRLAGVPGVEAVSTASAGPLFGGGDGATSFATPALAESEGLPSAFWYDAGPGHFTTLGLPLVAGREFTEADGAETPRVAVVNEAMARLGWPEGASPVGDAVRLPELDLAFEVVGVVADVPSLTPGEPPVPEIYWSNRQLPRPATFFLVRTRGAPTDRLGAVVAALLEVDPDLSLGTPRPLAVAEARALVRPRFQALVLAGLGLAGLALAWVGVYAVVSYAVARRLREVGIRMALGAAPGRVLRTVLRAGLASSALGVAVGMVGSVLAAGLIRGLVHGVRPTDPLSIVGAGALLMGAAALAALIPAYRVTRADPLAAMRAD